MELTILNYSDLNKPAMDVEYLLQEENTDCLVKQSIPLQIILTFIEDSQLNAFDSTKSDGENEIVPSCFILKNNTFDMLKHYLNYHLA